MKLKEENTMKNNLSKTIKMAVVPMAAFAIMISASSGASAFHGVWASSYQWDANGTSNVWSTNWDTERWVEVSVQRAGESSMGNKTIYLQEGQKNNLIMWGQPFLDRRGVVFHGGSHGPGFNA